MDDNSSGRIVEYSTILFDAGTIARIELYDSNIRQRLEHVEILDITYLSDGLRIKGILARPRNQAGAVYPCVIYNRGGKSDFGAITPEYAAETLGRISSWGYVVVASQYRGNVGGEGFDEYGGREINDVLNLIPLLENQPCADRSRLGIVGRSRGGLMTYLALSRSDRFAAAIVIAGITDFFDLIARRPIMESDVLARLVPDYENEKLTSLEMRSPILWAEKLCKQTPLLIMHGGADWRVHPTQALRMAATLYERHHPFRFVFFEGGDHGLDEFVAEEYQLIQYWLDRYVRDRQRWPSLDPH